MKILYPLWNFKLITCLNKPNSPALMEKNKSLCTPVLPAKIGVKTYTDAYSFDFYGKEKTDDINWAGNDNENGAGFKIRGWEGLISRNS